MEYIPVSKIIAKEISLHVDRVFLYPGGTIAPLIDSLIRAGVELFPTRNEQGAGYAAIGMAKCTGKPQVVMVTSGPGVTNIATVVADAYFDSVPLVVICGQVGEVDQAPDGIRQRGFQEVDTVGLMTPIAKKVMRLTSDNVEEVRQDIISAFYHASEGRAGPVVIDAPMNVLRSKVVERGVVMSRDGKVNHKVSDDDKRNLLRIAELIGESERPVIIAGAGVIAADAVSELRLLAGTCGIPVSTSLLGVGAMPTNHPLCLGFHGHTGSQVSGKAIYNSDLLIVVGSRLDVRQTGTLFDQFAPNAQIVRIDLDQAEMVNSRMKHHVGIVGDAKWALGVIIDNVLDGKYHTKDRSSWLTQIGEWRKDFSYYLPTAGRASMYPWTPIEMLSSVSRVIKKVIVVTGVGQHQSWVARHFGFDYPSKMLLTSGGHGAMGYDLPVAIGAQIAHPDALVLCVVGDGSFHMNSQELATMVSLRLPIKIMVLDNGRLGMVGQFQKLTWGDDPTCGDFWSPPFADIAKAYGFQHTTLIDTTDAYTVQTEMIKSLNSAGPSLMHVRTRYGFDISPMLLGGQRLDQMWWSEFDVKNGNRPLVEP